MVDKLVYCIKFLITIDIGVQEVLVVITASQTEGDNLVRPTSDQLDS